MKLSERKIYIIGYSIGAVLLVFVLQTLFAEIFAKNAVFADDQTKAEEFTVDDAETDLRGVFDDSTVPAMPCENPEAFERWMETYEQTASEESTGVLAEETTCGQIEMSETSAVLEVESASTVETDKEREIALYSFGDEMIEPYLQVMLYEALDRHGISYWYEIGLCEMWQESHGDIYAVNPRNGEDMGVMQYKVRYWDWSLGDIFSPEAQLELYATQMANRLNQGLSADECISRHKTSDYSTAVDWGYVQEVRQHLPNLRKVEL